jgi:glycosidase
VPLIVRTFADGGSPVAVGDPGAESGIDPATSDGIGDLVGLKNMLPYLQGLGADAIWMTPVFKAKSYHGYDTTDFYTSQYSTRKDFRISRRPRARHQDHPRPRETTWPT